MHLLLSLLALDHPDWKIPWAGIGAFMLGLGAVLSGAAALITARRKGQDESSSSTDSGSTSSSGERISDIGSAKSKRVGASEDGDS
jgi:hypothetical protein